MIIGVAAGVAGVLVVIGGLAFRSDFCLELIFRSLVFRNWKYEQELDSLLWRIEQKDLQVDFGSTKASFNIFT